MAAAKVMSAKVMDSVTRVEPGSYAMIAAKLPVANVTDDDDAAKIVAAWVASFNKVLTGGNFQSLKSLFLPEAYWRDQLCLSWDYHTFKGSAAMTAFLSKHSSGSRLKNVLVDDSSAIRRPTIGPFDPKGEVKGISSFLTVESDIGKGRGLVRLCKDGTDGQWKAFTLFTTMHELTGHEESVGSRRPAGVTHGANPDRLNWTERRDEEKNYRNGKEPTVFILGCGQAGLTLGARLKMLGVDTLLVDRKRRVGDSWRDRYHQLVLHDPVWYDHLPYMPFPEFWPRFTPKDKLGDWFEQYANSLELNTWCQTEVKSLKYDDGQGKWTVELERVLPDGKSEKRTLRPTYVVQATGHSGEKSFPSDMEGLKNFKGDFLGHSSEFPGARDGKGKKAIVVGCCNSGHDIAQNYYEKGYDTTMIQRSSTYVMSSENGLECLLGGLYEEGGPPLEDADLTFLSIPNAVLKSIHVDVTAEIARRDAKLLAGLRAAGFNADNGPDDSGFFMKYFQRGGGYYIDVGASQLIVDGKVRVKSGHGIKRVLEGGLEMDDGEKLGADEIVFATGYSNMRGTCRKIFGDETADRVKDVWGFDEEGELRTMWRRTGHPGLWFMGGNLGLCRYYSRMLALQIKALEVGLMKYDDI